MVEPDNESGLTDLRQEIIAMLPRLRRFCWALSRDSDRGDDLCQATVERALLRADQFEQGTRLDSWMYRIARNINIDNIRKTRTRGVETDIDDAISLVGDDGLRLVEGRSDLNRAQSAMAELPEDQRSLLAMVVFDGFSYREAADTLEIPIGTVMSRIARARKAIQLQLVAEGNG